MTSKRHTLVDYALGFSMALLGTINLWKVPSLRANSPVDLTVLSILLASLGCLAVFAHQRFRVEKHWWPVPLAFATFLPGAVVASTDNSYSTSKIVGLFTICLVATVAPLYCLRSEHLTHAFLKALGLMSLAVSLWLIFGGTQLTSNYSRFQIEDANPIGLARMSCAGAIIFFTALVGWFRIPKVLAGVGLAVCSIAAISTGSRGPIYATIVALLVTAALTARRTGRRSLMVGTLLTIIMTWFAIRLFAPATSIARVADGRFEESDVTRIQLATESLSISWSHPQGIGWGNLGEYLSPTVRSDAQGWVQYSHNILLELLVEGGAIAIIGALVLFITAARRLSSHATSHGGQTMLALWLMAFGSALASSDVLGNRLLWLLSGAAIALTPRYQSTPASVPHANIVTHSGRSHRTVSLQNPGKIP